MRNWFSSNECIALPVTDTCSVSFWRKEPTNFHTFDTINVINDHLDPDAESHLNDEEEEVNESEEEDYIEESPPRNLTLTKQ